MKIRVRGNGGNPGDQQSAWDHWDILQQTRKKAVDHNNKPTTFPGGIIILMLNFKTIDWITMVNKEIDLKLKF